jgi:hypothetical protein
MRATFPENTRRRIASALSREFIAIQGTPNHLGQRKMPDFAGHSYFFENEVSSFSLHPTKKKLFKSRAARDQRR